MGISNNTKSKKANRFLYTLVRTVRTVGYRIVAYHPASGILYIMAPIYGYTESIENLPKT